MKLRKKEKPVLAWVASLAYFSGATLFVFSHWIRTDPPVGEQHHALERWLRPLHSSLTYALVIGIGYMIKAHVLPGLNSTHKRRKATGLFVLSYFFVLIATALTILYSGETDWASTVAWIHALVGLSLPLGLGLHLSSRSAI